MTYLPLSLAMSSAAGRRGAWLGVCAVLLGTLLLSGQPAQRALAAPSGPLPVEITKPTASVNPSAYGQPVTFAVYVVTTDINCIQGRMPCPTGKIVVEYINAHNGISEVVGSPLVGAPGQSAQSVTFTTAKLPPGRNIIQGRYDGDSFYVGIRYSEELDFQVNPAATTTTVTSTTNPSVSGQLATFTATVSNTSAGSTAVPAGLVNFTFVPSGGGANRISSSVMLAATGPTSAQANLTINNLVPAGSPYTVLADYPVAGDDSVGRFDHSQGTATAPQVVTPPATAAASPAPAAAAPSQASTTASTTANGTTTSTAPTASRPSSTSAVPATSPPTGLSVTYPAGWNLVAGCGVGMPQAAATLYTFQAQDTDYESSPNTNALSSGAGYWAFFAQQATVGLPAGCAGGQRIQAPGGHYIMLGNSTQSSAVIRGLRSGDQALTYDPSSGQYTDITAAPTLTPGQGAWVYVANDATLSL